MKRAPVPLFIHSADISPEWLHTICLHTARPIPSPFCFVEKKGVKIFSLTSAVNPPPLSSTVIISHSLSLDSVTFTFIAVALVSIEFVSRLIKTCSI